MALSVQFFVNIVISLRSEDFGLLLELENVLGSDEGLLSGVSLPLVGVRVSASPSPANSMHQVIALQVLKWPAV